MEERKEETKGLSTTLESILDNYFKTPELRNLAGKAFLEIKSAVDDEADEALSPKEEEEVEEEDPFAGFSDDSGEELPQSAVKTTPAVKGEIPLPKEESEDDDDWGDDLDLPDTLVSSLKNDSPKKSAITSGVLRAGELGLVSAKGELRVGDMVYNPQLQSWEGNDAEMEMFDLVLDDDKKVEGDVLPSTEASVHKVESTPVATAVVAAPTTVEEASVYFDLSDDLIASWRNIEDAHVVFMDAWNRTTVPSSSRSPAQVARAPDKLGPALLMQRAVLVQRRERAGES